ncbi:WW domain-binding protein 2-like isoform X1 [Pituophis catenifer annectens]|uniref:WW domain-binding protein 2-like isoform X1 n=1 Tax=Pituophis catenifer annectens TaxID=94852 RepID=UPI003994ABF4
MLIGCCYPSWLLSPLNEKERIRVLAHYSEVVLFVEGEPDIPEELQGAKKGMLYLTQYKIIFQHKDKGSTIIRFPLQLLGDCFLEEEPDSKPQHIKGTLRCVINHIHQRSNFVGCRGHSPCCSSTQGLLAFKFTFQYGASDCLNMIKDLVDSDILKEATNLQEYPTASIYTYAHPAAPQATRSLNMLPLWPPPYPGPPELPPPYSEVEADPPGRSREAEIQETCCHCRGRMIQNPANRLD